MALDGTYTGLQASVADFLNRDDLTATIPDFITLAEGQMHRRFVARMRQGFTYPRRIVATDSLSLADGDDSEAVPTDFSGPLTLILLSTPQIELDYLDIENFRSWEAADSLNGLPPAYYTVVGSEFQFYPPCDQAYTAGLTYISRFPALSVSNTSNWILANYPDAYLYGAALQSAPYLKADSRAEMWATLFTAAIDDICNADPMPSDKSTLRTEFPVIQFSRSGYNVNTDNF